MHGPSSVWKWQCDMLMRNMKDGWNEHATHNCSHVCESHGNCPLNERSKAKGVWHVNHVSQYLHCYGHRINR
jgi:hypothetical protein